MIIPTGIPWKLIGYGAAALVLVIALGWVGNRIRVSYEAEVRADTAEAALKDERAQNTANIGKIAGRVGFVNALGKDLSGRLGAIDDRFNHLRFELPPPEALIQKKEVAGDPCPHVGLSADFVRMWNAASTEAGLAEPQAH